ncbi:MAG TPA: Crp/Fnr family transcriptional regulator [Bacteroidia bacterium]|jgi:CRP-like cAMP-binding protein|nr:Crp/Fnr family transcriptional regulator [Bacteroidia bacterium]
MYSILKDYLKGKINFTDSQFEEIKHLFAAKTVSKGKVLLQAGEINQHSFFVVKGCLRSYVIDKEGKEHIIQFAPENWWISDLNSYNKQEPAMFFIDAIEDSEVLMNDRGFNEKIAAIVPQADAMFQTLTQNSFRAMQKRLVSHLSATAEERYLEFIKTYPTLALRVPQKMIASYIGVAPESLSRIRKAVAHQ